MLPDRCSVVRGGKRCPSPPEFVVSVSAADGEYMVGVACGEHRRAVASRVAGLQKEGKLAKGSISFEPVRSVGTDCIRGDPDLVQID